MVQSSTNGSPHAGGRRLLVTGATGFIGSRLARRALAEGFAVRVLVRTDGPLPAGLEDAEPFRGDLTDAASLEGIETGVTHVVHGAGILGKWGSDDSELEAVNVEGGRNLLRRFAGIELSRYLHLSAGGVSGPVPTRAVDETYACRPATAYERTKLAGERAAIELGGELGIPSAVVRPTFTYGPGDPHKLALFRAVQRGRFAFIGDGESVLHPVFVDDLLAGILLALDRARTGEIYIVGGDRPVTKNELVFTIADALGVKRPRLRIPRMIARPAAAVLEAVGRRAGFEPILTRGRVMMMADNFGYTIAKARRELGYAPQVSLAEGIGRTVAAYREAGKL